MKIGQYQVSKSGTTRYLRLGAGVQAGSEGAAIAAQLIQVLGTDILFFNAPKDEVDGLVAAGKLDASQAEVRKSRIPEFILANVTAKKQES